MNYKFVPTTYFVKEAKRLSKKYRSLKDDLEELKKQLQANPMMGDDLGNGVRKVRMAITSKGGGKSGGARVITLLIKQSADDAVMGLLLIYDKSDYSNFKENVLKRIIHNFYDSLDNNP